MPHAVNLTDTSSLVSLCMDKSYIENYNSQNGIEILETLLLSPKIREQITKPQTELLLQAVSFIYELHDTYKKEMENDMLILCDRLTKHFRIPWHWTVLRATYISANITLSANAKET